MTINYLAPKSTPDSHGQARFDCSGNKVHVFQITGAATYIDREMSVEDARTLYKKLLAQGWAEPPAAFRYELHVLRNWLR